MSKSQMRMVWPRATGRTPQNENQVTFYKSHEFKLRDWIVKESSNKATPCMFEMSFVFTCLKDNNFNEKECFDEVKRFRNCYLDAIKKGEEIKMRRMNPGKIFSKKDKMISEEINIMLQKYKK